MEPGIHRPGFAISLEPIIQNSVLLFAYQNPTYASWLLGHQWNDHFTSKDNITTSRYWTDF